MAFDHQKGRMERCSLCGRELSHTPVIPQPPKRQKNKSPSLRGVIAVNQAIAFFLLLAAVARIIFGSQPLPSEELRFLIWAFGVTGVVALFSHALDRWNGK